MREIKFRAWLKDKKYLVTVKSLADWGITWWDGQYDRSYPEPNKEYEMENDGSYILMQYTGLKDKNGVEIYEGDIVKDDSNYIEKVVFEPFPSGDLDRYLYVGWNIEIATEYEIIGNIYENPELIKEVAR